MTEGHVPSTFEPAAGKEKRTGPRIQVRCIECGPVAPARLTRADQSFLASLAEWF